MGTSRKADKKRAVQLRLKGKSYNEIGKVLNVQSKGTISAWLKELKLPPSAKKILNYKIRRTHELGLSRFNKERAIRIKKENQIAFASGQDLVSKISRRELKLVGAALYWGEGTKTNARSDTPLSFANSDPKMVALFMRFLREIVQVPEERIRAGFHLYEGTSDEEGRKYWSSVTKLSAERFFVVRQVSKSSKGKRNKKLLPFGTAVIRVNNRKTFHLVMGMISALSNRANV